jgi:glutamate synthase (NADPH/NADH) large chain
MTGGMAFVHDPEGRFDRMANADTIVWRSIASAHWAGLLRALVEEHAQRTGSLRAQALVADWPDALRAFRQIVPKEMLARLTHPLDEAESHGVAAE